MRGMNYIYDMAYELEIDLKNLSESINKSATTPLIHRIINVLEELENHAQLYEIKRKEIDDLKKSIKRLEDEEAYKEKERLLHEKVSKILQINVNFYDNLLFYVKLIYTHIFIILDMDEILIYVICASNPYLY